MKTATARDIPGNSGIDAMPGMMVRVKTYLARNRAERQLHLMDDRMLADVGVKRGDIGRVVWGQ
jgi:uncharacterized protein YjiS (DUF1127 family)